MIKRGQGRRAWRVLKSNLLGTDHVKRMTTKLDEDIRATFWTAGDQRRHMDWYVGKMKSFHLRAAVPAIISSHPEYDEATKVRMFMNGIRGNELALALMFIHNRPDMVGNSQKAIDHVLSFIRTSRDAKLTPPSPHAICLR